MPKQKDIDSGVQFVDKIPPKTSGGKWVEILSPLVRNKGRYALVSTLKTPEQAQDTQNNLSQRKVLIPYPDHEWWFGARGVELYARYLGPIKKGR